MWSQKMRVVGVIHLQAADGTGFKRFTFRVARPSGATRKLCAGLYTHRDKARVIARPRTLARKSHERQSSG